MFGLTNFKGPVAAICCALLIGVSFGSANAQEADDREWVASWSASPQPTWDGEFPLPTLLPFNLWNQTVRQPVRVSLGGDRIRVVISNEYGDAPLLVDKVHVATAADEGAIVSSTDQVVTFSGQESVSIPAGAPMISDPIDMEVANLSELSVSMFFGGPTPVDTYHWDGQATSFIAGGNQVSATELTEAGPTTTRMFLTEIIVEADEGVRGVVAYGDSITDGAASGMDLNARWPDFLAENLASKNVAVVNAGISGARLLQSKMGENALARFDRDVLAHPNVDAVVVLMGINDIAWPGQVFAPSDPFLTVDELKTAYLQLAARAHLNDVRIIVGTLTPFKDALKGSPLEGYYNEERNALRQELNAWIRASGTFDAVVDLDKLVADSADPDRLQDEFQADFLHLSAAGNRVVADALTSEVLFGNN